MVELCSESMGCGGNDKCVKQEHVAILDEPHLLTLKGERVAYLEYQPSPPSRKCAIVRARVLGLQRWEIDPPFPVLEPGEGDEDCIGAPSVVLAADGIELFAATADGRSIVRARSFDGVHFERDAQPVLQPEAVWENGWIGSPGASRFAEATAIFYEADRGKAIGLATVQPNGEVSRETKPWLLPSDLEDPLFWRAIQTTRHPHPVVRDGTLLLYVTVRGIEGFDAISASGKVYPADVNDSIGLVATTDLLTWKRFPTGPVFTRRANLRAYLGEKQPAVLLESRNAWLVYASSDATGDFPTGLGLASGNPNE